MLLIGRTSDKVNSLFFGFLSLHVDDLAILPTSSSRLLFDIRYISSVKEMIFIIKTQNMDFL